uniref:Uncharacterized protein n=1 Tax=Ananas comosus var. bracteatus TaxID=296719 RepID=A0A6V7PEF7_ANACO|nr:unnamed protein product [Ananas comosus var. bracteatus]
MYKNVERERQKEVEDAAIDVGELGLDLGAQGREEQLVELGFLAVEVKKETCEAEKKAWGAEETLGKLRIQVWGFGLVELPSRKFGLLKLRATWRNIKLRSGRLEQGREEQLVELGFLAVEVKKETCEAEKKAWGAEETLGKLRIQVWGFGLVELPSRKFGLLKLRATWRNIKLRKLRLEVPVRVLWPRIEARASSLASGHPSTSGSTHVADIGVSSFSEACTTHHEDEGAKEDDDKAHKRARLETNLNSTGFPVESKSNNDLEDALSPYGDEVDYEPTPSPPEPFENNDMDVPLDENVGIHLDSGTGDSQSEIPIVAKSFLIDRIMDTMKTFNRRKFRSAREEVSKYCQCLSSLGIDISELERRIKPIFDHAEVIEELE